MPYVARLFGALPENWPMQRKFSKHTWCIYGRKAVGKEIPMVPSKFRIRPTLPCCEAICVLERMPI